MVLCLPYAAVVYVGAVVAPPTSSFFTLRYRAGVQRHHGPRGSAGRGAGGREPPRPGRAVRRLAAVLFQVPRPHHAEPPRERRGHPVRVRRLRARRGLNTTFGGGGGFGPVRPQRGEARDFVRACGCAPLRFLSLTLHDSLLRSAHPSAQEQRRIATRVKKELQEHIDAGRVTYSGIEKKEAMVIDNRRPAELTIFLFQNRKNGYYGYRGRAGILPGQEGTPGLLGEEPQRLLQPPHALRCVARVRAEVLACLGRESEL